MLLIGRAQGGPRMPDEGDEVVLVPCLQVERVVGDKSRDAPNFFPLCHLLLSMLRWPAERNCVLM